MTVFRMSSTPNQAIKIWAFEQFWSYSQYSTAQALRPQDLRFRLPYLNIKAVTTMYLVSMETAEHVHGY